MYIELASCLFFKPVYLEVVASHILQYLRSDGGEISVRLFPPYPRHMYDIRLKGRTFLAATENPGNHAVLLWGYKVNMDTE